MQKKVRKGWQVVVLLCMATIWMVPTYAWSTPGDGLRSGNYQLSPSVRLGTGYDSNVYYLSSNEDSAVPSSPTGILTPGLKISTVNINSWALGFDGALTWRQYFSDDKAVVGQSGLSTSLGGFVIWNPEGAVSLRLTEQFVRANETPNFRAETPFSRVSNRLGAIVGFHPGGRVLQSYIGYELGLHRHNVLHDLDRMVHSFTTRNYWKFLPKTALVLNGDYRLIRYSIPFSVSSDGDVVQAASGRIGNVNSSPLRITGGLNGLVTRRVSMRLLGGYGMSNHATAPSFQGALAIVEGSYRLGSSSQRNRIRLGYERNFNDSPVGNYESYHRLYAGYEQQLFQERLRLNFTGDVRAKRFFLNDDQLLLAETEEGSIRLPENLSDLLATASAELSYRIHSAWLVDLSYRFASNFTEDEVEIDIPGMHNIGRSFIRHSMMFSTTFRY